MRRHHDIIDSHRTGPSSSIEDDIRAETSESRPAPPCPPRPHARSTTSYISFHPARSRQHQSSSAPWVSSKSRSLPSPVPKLLTSTFAQRPPWRDTRRRAHRERTHRTPRPSHPPTTHPLTQSMHAQVLPDHTYLELLAFTHPTAHHTHTAHPWAAKRPGWIDLAFLGTPGTPSIAALINARADADGSGVQYTPETRGGRRRPDGRELEWVICAPVPRERGERGDVRGRVPFFCGDVTPRAWRVRALARPPGNDR